MVYHLLRPVLFCLDPLRAQAVAIAALKWLPLAPTPRPGPHGAVSLLGLRFANRIGLAAGFDKSACHLDELGRLGFGCIEVGTVTPRAQPGNPKPNLFRLVADEALINRLGFNNDGIEAVVRRLAARRYTGVCGVNIGKNADTPLSQSTQDYLTCLRAAYPVADYIAVNVSSPNTAGLRDLQSAAALGPLLGDLLDVREGLAGIHGKRVPLLLKLAPDLDPLQLDSICRVIQLSGIDGVIATNTTTSRPGSLRSRHAAESGGLSGRPLHTISVQVIRELRARLGRYYPIVGVGGICDLAGAQSTLAAGANLLQVYTGLIYEGPRWLARLIARTADVS